jgi:hypothetical protein
MVQKDLRGKIEAALAKCHDQTSFFQLLLNDTLEWPIGDIEKIEDISFGWSADELQAAGIEPKLVEGPIWQVQPLEQAQPWGVFVLEFKHPDTISHRRGMAGVLRRVLRGLVASRRKDPNRPSWKHEHLLFICTYRWTTFRFAYFRSAPEDSRTPKLKTFGWAPDTPNRTVCEFNLPKLVWPDDPVKVADWLAQWGEAFDKEPLTSDFFKRFDNALEKIQEDLQEYQKLQSAEAYTQAQLLLERLIFLYFLQNRGWLNQEPHFLHNKFQEYAPKPDGFGYYKEFLDKLFWTLSTAPGSSGGRLTGIPFLNGGLFDDDEFAQPADLRKTNPPLRVRNTTFRYVFDELLEAFNFTVTEDTPLNQDVAVDPEMLGKVFESIVLHAEQADPDAVAPDKRKATGSYYTPRIVVHFICQEVLYQYLLDHLQGEGWEPRLRTLLAIDTSDGIDGQEKELIRKTITPEQGRRILDLVKPLRCCDPAVGSGAFPVGLLHELANFRRVLETAANGYVDPARGEGYTWLQKTKEDIVQNCLFGVDIQQQAIEICRLRLWLSLVVDYDLGVDPFEADKSRFNSAIDGISQLPNLEMNFHRGDSLHDHISGVPIVIMPDKASRHVGDFQAISKLGQRLHRAKRAEQKRKLRVEILTKRLDLSRSIIQEELRALDTDESSLNTLFHDETDSSTNKRKRIAQEKERLLEALDKIAKDRKDLEKLNQREFDNQFYVKLRKLEGADFDSPFNFVWYIDFPGIFEESGGTRGGFDIIVGNPPFVTARNPHKRELWRERWPLVSHRKFQLLAPFFACSFDLLKPSGELGFIVSNAFAKREFGRPLVEQFFSKVDLQKIVDCSGLMFPGHGTPTCIILGSNQVSKAGSHVRVVGIMPGGGDLRTPPEESSLWSTLAEHHDIPGFSDQRISVSDRPRGEISQFPWNFDAGSQELQLLIEHAGSKTLSDFVDSIGICFFTNAEEVFQLPPDFARRLKISADQLEACQKGEDIRDWSMSSDSLTLRPYDRDWSPIKLDDFPAVAHYLRLFRKPLGNRATFSGKTYDEEGKLWYGYHIINSSKLQNTTIIGYSFIATHVHCCLQFSPRLYRQTAPIIVLRKKLSHHVLAGLLNSSTALFWLKQVCFSKRESEEAESDTYYEFAAGNIEKVPVPTPLASALVSEQGQIGHRLGRLAEACWHRASGVLMLGLRKVFEKPGEAYLDWITELPAYTKPANDLGSPFDDTESICKVYQRVKTLRSQTQREMIAFQEEMDWLIYAAYGLLQEDHTAAQIESDPAPLNREDRPFVLWAQAQGDLSRAVQLIPTDWPVPRKALWEARLIAIRDNEHIRRIEQPIYKRRWDEQWKVANHWCCGPIAYAAEFVDAFEWWLREKAEWWLEHKQNGGPVDLDTWTDALWREPRVQAAWPVAAEQYAYLETEKAREKAEENGEAAPAPEKPRTDTTSFRQEFKRIIEDETVPAGFPFAVPYEDLEKKLKKKVPAKLRSIRGKLNVPRERFHRHDDDTYSWAGLQFK